MPKRRRQRRKILWLLWQEVEVMTLLAFLEVAVVAQI
jgi:hypothetical protein